MTEHSLVRFFIHSFFLSTPFWSIGHWRTGFPQSPLPLVRGSICIQGCPFDWTKLYVFLLQLSPGLTLRLLSCGFHKRACHAMQSAGLLSVRPFFEWYPAITPRSFKTCVVGMEWCCALAKMFSAPSFIGCILLGLFWLFLFQFRNDRIHGISISKRTLLHVLDLETESEVTWELMYLHTRPTRAAA